MATSAIGPADLQALEDRFERRLAELELRHQRHLDSVTAKREKDVAQLEEALSVSKRCEQDLDVVSEWRRETAAQLAAFAGDGQRTGDMIEAARASWLSAVDETRQSVETVAMEQKSLQERLRVIAEKVDDLVVPCKASHTPLGNGQGDGEVVDVQDLFSRSPWAKSLDRQVLRTAEQLKQALSQIETLEALERKVTDLHADVRELHARWGADAAERAETLEQTEARVIKFSESFDELASSVRCGTELQKGELRQLFEEQLAIALKDVEPCNAACATLHEALESQMQQLHGERAAMRRAWDRVEALRKDETWGYFLRNDSEWSSWRSDIGRRLSELEDEVTQGSNAVWPEIGHLGCRVADLHAVLDERVPPKDGSKVAVPPRSATQAGAPTSLRAGSGATGKPSPQARSPPRLISAKPSAVKGGERERGLVDRLTRPRSRRPQDDDETSQAGRSDASAGSKAGALKRVTGKSGATSGGETEESRGAADNFNAAALDGRAVTEKESASNSSSASANTSTRTNTPPRKVRSGVSPDTRSAVPRTRSGRLSPGPQQASVSRTQRRSFAEDDLSTLIPDIA